MQENTYKSYTWYGMGGFWEKWGVTDEYRGFLFMIIKMFYNWLWWWLHKSEYTKKKKSMNCSFKDELDGMWIIYYLSKAVKYLKTIN